MSFVAVAITGISAGLGFYAQQQAADAAEEAAEHNAKIAEDQAKQKELENHETVNRQRKDKRRAKAQAFAKLAAGGAALGEGSSVDVMEVLDSRLETEIQDTSRAAHLEARNLRIGAANQRYSGAQQSASLKLQSYGTLLDGASKTAGQFSAQSSADKPKSKTKK